MTTQIADVNQMDDVPGGQSSILHHAVDRLVRAYSPSRIILFGSRARGESRSDSDIDLLIIKDTRDRIIDRWMAVRRILSDPQGTVAIETLVLTPEEVAERLASGDQFLCEVMQKGITLYVA